MSTRYLPGGGSPVTVTAQELDSVGTDVTKGFLMLCTRFASLALSAFVLGAAAAEPVSLRQATVLGWEGHELHNGLLSAVVVPRHGGRILSFRLGEHEFLWTNPDLAGKDFAVDHANLNQHEWIGGGFTWLAPQESWTITGTPWPPPPMHVLSTWEVDSTVQEDGARVLDTRGPAETRAHWNAAGIRLARRLTLHPQSARLQVEHRMINTSDRHQAWGVWSNVQINASVGAGLDPERFWVYFPVRRDGQYAPHGWMWYGSAGKGADQTRSFGSENVAAVQYMRRNGKLGADSDGGWMCSLDAKTGWAFTRRFRVDLRRPYAENRHTIAVYTSGRQPLIEVEVMGPVEQLPPGAEATFSEEWGACRVEGPVLAVVEAGVISRRLLVDAWGEPGRLSGSYGVLDQGTAVVVFTRVDGTQAEVWQKPVSPLEPLMLHERFDLRDVTTATVVIRPVRGGEWVLDHAEIPERSRRTPDDTSP